MKIIIVGAGEIGRHMALSLSREQHAIVVIEADERVASELDSKIDARVMHEDGASINTLLEAGVSECELFLALTSDNNINLVASTMAKALGAAQVICRVHPGLQREEFLFDLRSHFGIDYIFSSERLAAIELAKFVRNPHAIFVEEIARGHIELQQVKVSRESSLILKPLHEMEFPPRVRVGAILRGEQSIIPRADDMLEPGDVVTLFGDPNRLHEVAWKLQEKEGSREQETNVVIFGGGEYGFSLAQTMESWNSRIRIFEANPARCEHLTDTLANVTVLNADATSLAELKEENVGKADYFIAVTEVDEDNVMTCIQAHSLGAKSCLTLIHRADYADAMTGFGERMGIRAAISPREATRRDLMRFVKSDKFHLVRRLHAGELIEAAVAEGSEAEGKKVKDVKWPENCVLMALLHGLRAVAPAADDEIAAGDHLYALVAPKAKKPFLKLVSG
ncbi:MAG: Trk system potassium transporter TrkA [Verrucomicrobiae bacterium]|nr:Trk system potassium transporter TrkA [Verrucomicrobiae bacterium]